MISSTSRLGKGHDESDIVCLDDEDEDGDFNTNVGYSSSSAAAVTSAHSSKLPVSMLGRASSSSSSSAQRASSSLLSPIEEFSVSYERSSSAALGSQSSYHGYDHGDEDDGDNNDNEDDDYGSYGQSTSQAASGAGKKRRKLTPEEKLEAQVRPNVSHPMMVNYSEHAKILGELQALRARLARRCLTLLPVLRL